MSGYQHYVEYFETKDNLQERHNCNLGQQKRKGDVPVQLQTPGSIHLSCLEKGLRDTLETGHKDQNSKSNPNPGIDHSQTGNDLGGIIEKLQVWYFENTQNHIDQPELGVKHPFPDCPCRHKRNQGRQDEEHNVEIACFREIVQAQGDQQAQHNNQHN